MASLVPTVKSIRKRGAFRDLVKRVENIEISYSEYILKAMVSDIFTDELFDGCPELYLSLTIFLRQSRNPTYGVN